MSGTQYEYERIAREAIAKLAALPQADDPEGKTGTDWEAGHSQADDVLCDVLQQLGLGDVVEAWRKVGRWYA